MSRVLIAIAVVAVLAAPTMAYDTNWDFPSGGTADGNIDIYLELDCYVQIDWQDTEIHFDGAGDWWSENLMGTAYQACPTTEPDNKIPTDPWAGDHWYAPNGLYYESADGALIYVRSNNPLSMMVHTNGDLEATDPTCGDCTIPTWFTLCLAPFEVAGVPIGVGNIPGDGWGTYVHPVSTGILGYDDPVMGLHPDQYAFACDPFSQEWYLGPLCPGVGGTMKFLARIHRNGMLDAGGDYSTFLDVHFTSP